MALSQRIAGQPRADDPDRQTRLAELEALLAEHPEHLGVREAMIAALADAGEPDRGRAALDGWPGPPAIATATRDIGGSAAVGTWNTTTGPPRPRPPSGPRCEPLPQDWRSWYRLARALRQLGRDAEAHQAAEAVGRIREALEPTALGTRLDDDFRHLDDPRRLRDLAALSGQAGLAPGRRLARAEADNAARAAPRRPDRAGDRRHPGPAGFSLKARAAGPTAGRTYPPSPSPGASRRARRPGTGR